MSHPGPPTSTSPTHSGAFQLCYRVTLGLDSWMQFVDPPDSPSPRLHLNRMYYSGHLPASQDGEACLVLGTEVHVL